MTEPAPASGAHDASVDVDASTTDVDAAALPCFLDAAPRPAPVTQHGFVGAWQEIPGLPPPPTCTVYQAVSAPASIGKLTWSPCASGRAGCQSFLAPWGQPLAHLLEFTSTEPVRVVNGTPTITYEQIVPNLTSPGLVDAYLVGVQPVDADPVVAIGLDTSGQGCAFTVTIGDDGVAAVVQTGAASDAYVIAAPWCGLGALHAIDIPYAALGLPSEGFVQYHAFGAAHLFFELRTPNTIDVVQPQSGSVQFAGAPSRAYAGFPTSVAGGAVVYDYAAPTGIGFVGADASYVVLRKPVSGSVVTAYAVDHAASVLVWVEGVDTGNGIAGSMIWTSPSASSPAGIQPRTIAALNDALGAGGLGMVANAGAALNVVAPTQALLTRLSDGMGWTIVAEAGTVFVRPIWVDDGEVWISTANGTASNSRADQSGILRLKRSALGPPTVAPGL